MVSGGSHPQSLLIGERESADAVCTHWVIRTGPRENEPQTGGWREAG